MKKLLALGAALFLVGTGAIGCQKTAEGVAEDTNKNVNAVDKAADKAVDATKDAAKDVKDTVKEGTANTSLNLKVKDAIVADSELNDTKNLINVEPDAKNNE